MTLGYKHTKQQESDYYEVDDLIVQLLADDPFVTQEEICTRFDLSKEELIEKNTVYRNDPAIQNFILNLGDGKKYWNNSIIPQIQSGKFHAALNGKYAYPDRIGLYPGKSCMFYCSFCGRNYNAKYKDYGLEIFKSIIDNDPRDTNYKQRFRISGGLEPLTNPHIGELISYGTERGFNMQMYTNGYMLTPKFINKQPGMLELEAMRISLYGINEEETFKVTRKRGAFIQVSTNIIEFQKLNSNVKLGLNFVILPGNADHVLKLLDLIQYMNEKSGNQIKFLTLREDFSENVKHITDEERIKFYNIFAEVEERLKHPLLDQLHIDYGYALEPLRHSPKSEGPIKMVNFQYMREKAFPQIATAVDNKGDVYLYHEAGFLDRPGANRYIIGTVDHNNTIESIVKQFVRSNGIVALPPDTGFMDAFDHVMTILLNQAEADAAFGIPWEQGPIAGRIDPQSDS